MASAPLFAPRHADDRSTHAHRQLIGYLGMALPLFLIVLAGIRPTQGLAAWKPLGSISAYYYTGAIVAFVGLLAALAVFLFTYRGYGEKSWPLDRVAAWVAGAAAAGVALFPTGAPGAVVPPSWWTPEARTVHYISAVVLFSSFAFFSLFLFTRSSRSWNAMPGDKKRRNVLHIACGLGIVASMVWAGVAATTDRSIFWPEVAALELFAVSWLAKGHAVQTWRAVGQRAVGLLMRAARGDRAAGQ